MAEEQKWGCLERREKEEENCLSSQKNHVSKKKEEEDEKRKERRDDKFKTLSFASIYSHERKKKEESSVQSGNAWSCSLSLKVAVVIICLIKGKSINLSCIFFCSHSIRNEYTNILIIIRINSIFFNQISTYLTIQMYTTKQNDISSNDSNFLLSSVDYMSLHVYLSASFV